jgi:hypothetical protein
MTIEEIITNLVEAGYAPYVKKAVEGSGNIKYLAATMGLDSNYYSGNTIQEACEALYKAVKEKAVKQLEVLR